MATTVSVSQSPDPIPFEKYSDWLIEHGVRVDAHQVHYDVVCRALVEGFSLCPFWAKLRTTLRNVDASYQVANDYALISGSGPVLIAKPWESFLHKTYRKNILGNPAFPNPPADGWYLPPNWFDRIHDIVRTTIEVRYLDGVRLVLTALAELAKQDGIVCKSDLEARVDGYYGAHFQCDFVCQVPDLNWKKYSQQISVEIQVTTSMKEVIKKLLHGYYEHSRKNPKPPTIEEISWNYSTGQFNAAYLGHILHYIEGMILEVRKQQKA